MSQLSQVKGKACWTFVNCLSTEASAQSDGALMSRFLAGHLQPAGVCAPLTVWGCVFLFNSAAAMGSWALSYAGLLFWIGRRAGPEHNEEIWDTVQAAAAEDQNTLFRPTWFALIEFLGIASRWSRVQSGCFLEVFKVAETGQGYFGDGAEVRFCAVQTVKTGGDIVSSVGW